MPKRNGERATEEIKATLETSSYSQREHPSRTGISREFFFGVHCQKTVEVAGKEHSNTTTFGVDEDECVCRDVLESAE